MSDEAEEKEVYVNYENLPENFPTHRHSAEFWEALGRTVASFGFLEEVLGKAILVFSGQRTLSQEDAEAALRELLPTLEKALTDSLGGQIDTYEKVVRNNSEANVEELKDLLEKLREASSIRNVICHGSWRQPNDQGQSIPFYVKRKKMEVFQDQVDVEYLQKVREHTAELACWVINSVTRMGWQFPGSNGPGIPI